MILFYNLTITLFLIIIFFHFIGKDKESFVLRLIFIFHLIFFLINFFYKDYFASDSNGYIKWSLDKSYIFSLGRGTTSIVYIVKFFNFLKINFFNIHLIFSLIGFIGIYIFFKIINEKNPHILNKIIFFIPSWHFYTSTIGKETILAFLLSICLFYFERKKTLLFLITFPVIYLIRPNVSILFGLLLFPLFLNNLYERYLYNKKILFKRLSLIILFLILILIFFNYQEIKAFALNILNFIEQRQSYFYLGKTGYAVDDLNIFQILFYYLFMPIGFDLSKNIFYFYSGLENIFLILYFFVSLIVFNYKNLKLFNLDTYLIIFISFFLILVSIVNTNLGLAMRQKWMILPFIFYIFSIYSNYYKVLKK